jgi:hypothetical protein
VPLIYVTPAFRTKKVAECGLRKYSTEGSLIPKKCDNTNCTEEVKRLCKGSHSLAFLRGLHTKTCLILFNKQAVRVSCFVFRINENRPKIVGLITNKLNFSDSMGCVRVYIVTWNSGDFAQSVITNVCISL